MEMRNQKLFILFQMVYFITRYTHSTGKLVVGWVWCHYPQPRRHCKGNGLVLGALMGVPRVPDS